jgi:hypothetical protein
MECGTSLEDGLDHDAGMQLHLPLVHLHLPVVRLVSLCAAIALAYYVRALHQRLDQLELALLAREQRVELLCEQLKTAVETGHVEGGVPGMTLASLGGVDISLKSKPDATVGRWLVSAAQWFFRS